MAKSTSSMGCYGDSGHSPILSGIQSQNLNQPSFDSSHAYFSCQQFCGKYQFSYFGINEGKTCTCGNNLPSKVAKSSEVNCELPCQDNGKENCGGYGYTSIFVVNPEQIGSTEISSNASVPDLGGQNPTSAITSPPKTPPLNGSNSVTVTTIPTAFIDNTGLMAAVFTLAGVVLIGCGVLGCVLYQRKRRITSYDLTSDESLQTTYLWQRRSSLSLRDDMDYTKKLRITNPDVGH
ncbi:hypothetical protein K493DRAFT_296845 [Basidiobolus meristosporus CBS 931.73]|uniref:WSC domain-containing protein n=1 Tax=Basidiobolus meristosporus CBS 931.73 TaxID=1314790 RepID=A0A1Y1Z360_9FUNG|nr:hypothetical protein K493DRAFT_296845 [Basidiobolus meristosporus CBS 931.73]|eukprot:ORY04722.1 hypothetical protein K493DRAFT_296845 [Basidiobolus meristosporus CBS 931.73]